MTSQRTEQAKIFAMVTAGSGAKAEGPMVRKRKRAALTR